MYFNSTAITSPSGQYVGSFPNGDAINIVANPIVCLSNGGTCTFSYWTVDNTTAVNPDPATTTITVDAEGTVQVTDEYTYTPPIPAVYDNDSCEYVGSFDCYSGTAPSGYRLFDCVTYIGSCVVIGFTNNLEYANASGACVGTIAIGTGTWTEVAMYYGSRTAVPYGADGEC